MGEWIKSSFSTNPSGCVEVMRAGNQIYVRSSQDPDGPVLRFLIDAEWEPFLRGAAIGEFNPARLEP